MEKRGRKKPQHRALAQHRQHGHLGLVRGDGLLEVRQEPDARRHGRQRQRGPGGKLAHAGVLEPGARREHRDQKAQRAPQPHAPVAPGVERAALADQMRHGRLAHRHHRAGVGEHHQQHHAQPQRAQLEPQPQRDQQRGAGAITQQLHALAGVVAQPAPAIGRKQARGGLHRGQHADGEQAETQLFEPQRQVGVEETDVGEIARRQRRKRRQLAAAGGARAHARFRGRRPGSATPPG
jgi:hypothetical protein